MDAKPPSSSPSASKPSVKPWPRQAGSKPNASSASSSPAPLHKQTPNQAKPDGSRVPCDLLDIVLYMFYGGDMDWAYAIERHRQPLLGIVATLYAMIGLTEGGKVGRLSWPLYRAVLSVLRPAEAAVRRLIVVAARGLVMKPYVPRPAPAGLFISGRGQGLLCFRLFDPRAPQDGTRRCSSGPRPAPRIRILDVGFDPRVPLFRRPATAVPGPESQPQRDDTVSATPLCRRLAAIRRALSDLPRQARRYARWRAKPVAARHPKLGSMLRPGPPPYL